MTTQVPNEGSDLTTEAAVAKLMWIMGQTREFSEVGGCFTSLWRRISSGSETNKAFTPAGHWVCPAGVFFALGVRLTGQKREADSQLSAPSEEKNG